ncbi:MAG: hypothetical protein JWP57_3789 [Spirosoma sp.]|nr:hypothetical protein [Spirosoma sp.]
MMHCWLLSGLVVLSFLATASAQKFTAEEFRVRVVTKCGKQTRGILHEVTDEYLYLDYINPKRNGYSERIPLSIIRKVLVRSNRKNTLEGGILGGGLAAFLTIRSSKKNGFHSPVVYALNLTIAVGGGAAIGAIIGRNIRPLTPRRIRPYGQTPEEAARSLRLQLEPLAYANQTNILNRIPREK